MAKFVIQGKHPIGGILKPAGNKNAALPMLAASLLTDQPVVLKNLPLIKDVMVMLELLGHMGVDISLRGHTVTLQARNIKHFELNSDDCRKIRGSILVAGPMAARFGTITLSAPGGDVIGRRRLDTHFYGFGRLGMNVDIDASNASITITGKHLRGADMVLDEASVTATENIVMAATIAPGLSTIYNAACEPHVQDLCHLLNKMGARIEGIGTNLLKVEGVEQLSGATCGISPDYIEAGSFLAAAAATGGELRIPSFNSSALQFVARPFNKLGVKWTQKNDEVVLSARQSLSIQNDVGNFVPKIEDGIWPAFPSDLMSVVLVLATQAKGNVLFFEKLFESRMYFVDRLIDMGASIVQCDPHRVVVNGPSRLYGSRLSSPDIRAGMALLTAALCAEGESVIENAQIIDRGYEAIDKRLRKLGAHIEREK